MNKEPKLSLIPTFSSPRCLILIFLDLYTYASRHICNFLLFEEFWFLLEFRFNSVLFRGNWVVFTAKNRVYCFSAPNCSQRQTFLPGVLKQTLHGIRINTPEEAIGIFTTTNLSCLSSEFILTKPFDSFCLKEPEAYSAVRLVQRFEDVRLRMKFLPRVMPVKVLKSKFPKGGSENEKSVSRVRHRTRHLCFGVYLTYQ